MSTFDNSTVSVFGENPRNPNKYALIAFNRKREENVVSHGLRLRLRQWWEPWDFLEQVVKEKHMRFKNFSPDTELIVQNMSTTEDDF